jgi:hypothetical protein
LLSLEELLCYTMQGVASYAHLTYANSINALAKKWGKNLNKNAYIKKLNLEKILEVLTTPK